MSANTMDAILAALWVLCAVGSLWLVSLALSSLATVRRVTAWSLGQRDLDPRDPSTRERMRGLRW